MACFAVTSELYSVAFILATASIYMLAMLADTASFIWRCVEIAYYAGAGKSFLAGIISINALLVAIDVVAFFTLMATITQVKRFTTKVDTGLKSEAISNLELEVYKRVPYALYKARRTMRLLSMMEILLLGGILVLYTLGLSPSYTFSVMAAAHIFHVFLWIGAQAVAKGVLDAEFVVILMSVYIITGILETGAFSYRLYFMIECHANGTIAGCIWLSPFAWMTTAFGLVLLIFSFVQAKFSHTTAKWLDSEYKRLLPFAKRRLRVTTERFYGSVVGDKTE
jgi:hypothetical protein